MELIGERLRMNFRDYFFYSIKGYTGDPIKQGMCNNNCTANKGYCCVKVTAFDIKTELTAIDMICMDKFIAKSQNNITLS